MKGIYEYLWMTNKRYIKFNLIKNSTIIVFIIAIIVSAKKYLIFNSNQAGLIILLFLLFVLFTNVNYFASNYSTIYKVRFDRFIASTSVGYRSLLIGLISSNLLLNMFDFLVCIFVMGLLKKIVFATSVIYEIKLLAGVFLIYTIWTLLLIPLIVYFKENKTAVLLLTFACMAVNIAYMKKHDLNELAIPNSILIFLVTVGILLFFIALKVSEILWKSGD